SDPAGSSVDYEVFDFSEVLILCVDDFTADHRLLGWNYICVSDYSRFCDGFHVYTSLLKGSWLTRLLPPPHGKRDENGYLFTSRHIRVLFTSLEKRCLSVAAEKLRQSPCVCLSDLGNRVIVSLQGGSPFLSKVSTPTLPRAGSRTPPQPSTMEGTPSVREPMMDPRQSPALSLRACSTSA